MSTRVEGAEPPVITITAVAHLMAGKSCLMLTVTEEAGGLWKYSLSEREAGSRERAIRAAYGRLTAADYTTALRRASAVLADGYAPGSTERGLLEMFAEEGQ